MDLLLKYFISILFCVYLNIGYSQNTSSVSFDSFERLFNDMKFDSIIFMDENTLIRTNKLKEGEILSIYAEAFENLNKNDKAFEYYKKSKKYFQSKQNLEKVAYINSKIYFLLDSHRKLKIDKSFYINDLKEYAFKTNSQKWIMTYYNLKGVDFFKPSTKDSAKYYFLKAKNIAKSLDSTSALHKYNVNLGALNLVYFNQPDSAIYYYTKALKLYEIDNETGKKTNNLFALYNNLGNAYREKKEYNKALEYYNEAEKLDLRLFDKISKRILYSNMDVAYYYMDDFENAYDYLYKYDSINEIINLKEQNTNIKNIEEKFDNEKLRADNLQSESKRKENQNIAFGLGGILALGSIIAFLIFKNAKRKQLVAEQEKEIESQKLASLLKEQELNTIDAMIEGQEKERQRIANDLHDDLGGLMATVKLHFNALKVKESPELYDKTNTLIEEAYQKIRSVAHAKNSGVIAKQGLLKAVQNMANKISAANKVQVEVVYYGLDNRLENSLELTLFRIVQELVTNVIKHAEATEVIIHLTNHEDSINIMVEDDGKGFNPNQITKKNAGMGISSIDKRVEYLEGKMTIESEKNSGTTIIIDIPL